MKITKSEERHYKDLCLHAMKSFRNSIENGYARMEFKPDENEIYLKFLNDIIVEYKNTIKSIEYEVYGK